MFLIIFFYNLENSKYFLSKNCKYFLSKVLSFVVLKVYYRHYSMQLFFILERSKILIDYY